MKNFNHVYHNAKQGILPFFLSDALDICDPVLTFDRFMEGIDLEKYLEKVPRHKAGRLRYNPVNMLKTVLFGFMSKGYISLRELEDECKVNMDLCQYFGQKKLKGYDAFLSSSSSS